MGTTLFSTRTVRVNHGFEITTTNSTLFTVIKRYKHLLLVFAVCSFSAIFNSNELYAATITSTTAGGDWHTSGTWVGGVVPTATDDVIIDGDVSVSVFIAQANILTINAGTTLTVGIPNITTFSDTYVYGTLKITNASQQKYFKGTLHILSGGTFDNSVGSANVAFDNSIDNSGTFIAGGGFYEFRTTNPHSITGTVSLNQLRFDYGADNMAFDATTNLTLNLLFNVDALINVAISTSGGNVNLNGDVSGNFTWSAAGSSVVNYSAASPAQNIIPGTYATLNLSGSAKTLISGKSITSTTISIAPGISFKNNGTITMLGGTNTLTITSGTTYSGTGSVVGKVNNSGTINPGL